MCTFRSERAVVVCDIAIEHVREQMTNSFPGGITYQVAEGGGTLVKAGDNVASRGFEEAVRQGIRVTESVGS